MQGAFPGDQPRMLAIIDRYLALPEDERLLFRLGRRGGALRSLDELDHPLLRSRLEQARRELAGQGRGDLEAIITELGDQYL